MSIDDALVMIFSKGGEGKRLFPLITKKMKPKTCSSTFGGRYRIIDFVINNFINSVLKLSLNTV